MATMQPYVKKWYDAVEDGKITGMRCKRCGAYEFPPVPVCNACSSTDLEWVEMSGKGKLVSFSVMQLLDKVQIKYGRRVIGQVVLEEGPAFTATVEGVEPTPEATRDLYDRLPIDVTMGIMQLDGFKFPSFRLSE